jgi:TetR/AcrR family transcriptional repressor of nem operon
MGRVSDAKVKLMEAIGELIWTGSYGSTTIDQICEKAGVKKGSFYYFFDSKVDLAHAALTEDWEHRRRELDSIFSPTVPPLERLAKYCDFGYRLQAQMREKYGCTLGCPLCSVGTEVSTQEDRLQKKIKEILEQKRMYFESAIRDAKAAGLIPPCDPESKSRMLAAYYQGLATQARIANSVEVFKEAIRGTHQILGVAEAVSS